MQERGRHGDCWKGQKAANDQSYPPAQLTEDGSKLGSIKLVRVGHGEPAQVKLGGRPSELVKEVLDGIQRGDEDTTRDERGAAWRSLTPSSTTLTMLCALKSPPRRTRLPLR